MIKKAIFKRAVQTLERIDITKTCMKELHWWDRLFKTKRYRLSRNFLLEDIEVLSGYVNVCHQDLVPNIQKQLNEAKEVFEKYS